MLIRTLTAKWLFFLYTASQKAELTSHKKPYKLKACANFLVPMYESPYTITIVLFVLKKLIYLIDVLGCIVKGLFLLFIFFWLLNSHTCCCVLLKFELVFKHFLKHYCLIIFPKLLIGTFFHSYHLCHSFSHPLTPKVLYILVALKSNKAA